MTSPEFKTLNDQTKEALERLMDIAEKAGGNAPFHAACVSILYGGLIAIATAILTTKAPPA